ncbi:MAG: SprT family zinc-dependent metalloprotease [Pseudomonadota bacterium]
MTINRPDTMVLSTEDGTKVTVRLEINDKARRLILRLDERSRQAVAVAPNRRKLPDAAQFAAERVDWIADRLAELPPAISLAPGATFPLRGEPCKISLEGPGRRARLIHGDGLVLRVPGDPETTPQRVIRFLRTEAKRDLERSVVRHCKILHRQPRAISVKDTRSRWGSCTSDGRLSFSWRLIMAPPDVLEYVAAHECAHLLEMNHSPAFWAHVSRCCADWKIHRRWLREEGRALHAVGV